MQVLILTFIHRFSAPDLMMRYHWGLGVGHSHVHQPVVVSNITTPIVYEPGDSQDNQSSNLEPDGTSYSNVDALGDDDHEYSSDDPELGLEDRHLPDEGWEDTDTDGASDGGGHSEEEDYTGC